MKKAAETAQEREIPVILDPVGAGATSMRTATALSFLEEDLVTILRGNASEIMALHGSDARTKGVESVHESEVALAAARELAAQGGCIVSLSGAADYITDGDTVLEVLNGHPMMTKVTGMGCAAAAVTGAFAAVNESVLQASAHAMAAFGMAGEMAAKKAEGPGTFQVHFLDALDRLDKSDIQIRLRTRNA
jgi:hydroxyethylthiazole kinase